MKLVRAILFFLCMSVGFFSVNAQQPVYSLEYLNALCTRMAKQVGLDPKKITVAYHQNIRSDAQVSKIDNHYCIVFDEDSANMFSNDEIVAVMGHELMHVLHGDCDREIGFNYTPLSTNKRRIATTCLALLTGAACIKGFQNEPSRAVLKGMTSGIVTYAGMELMSKLLSKYSDAVYASVRSFLCSRYGIVALASGVAAGGISECWMAHHDDMVTRGICVGIVSAVAGMKIVELFDDAKNVFKTYRYFSDSRIREAWADRDAVQKFHCQKGMISFLEKCTIPEKSHSFFCIAKKNLKNVLWGTHPTPAQRIAALKPFLKPAV